MTHRFLAKIVRAVDPGAEADKHVTGGLLTGTRSQMKGSLFLLKYFKDSCN